jgi:hypothetical protein
MFLAAAALTLVSAQAPCGGEAVALLAEAATHAAGLDLPTAADRLEAAVQRGCGDAEVAALYVRGLVDAREAFRLGGSPASLAPVHEAIRALEGIARSRPGPAGIARLVLLAAAAAAQSERDEMRLYLEAAVQMESVQRAAGQHGAPVVPAIEVAGDLWLRVHRYDDARRAYLAAADATGRSLRVTAGLARVADRLGDIAAACDGYRLLLQMWGSRTGTPPDVVYAREYLETPACQTDGAR